jgi:multiple antibiotic resistance protein
MLQLGPVDIFTILFITVGPLKAMIVFASLTARADTAFRRQVAFRAVAVAAIVLFVFAFAGEGLLRVFHITLPALKIAGGLILLLFALHMVMGEEKPEGEVAAQPSLGIAIYPIAVPMLATPQGIVAIVTMTAAADTRSFLFILGFLAVVLVIDVIVLLVAGRIIRFVGQGTMVVIGKVAGILLAALAVQLMLWAATDLGLIAKTAGH